MIRRIRDRRSFERLARDGTRIRRSALWCTWCPEPNSTTTSVAFAFGRAFGTAVERNRMRRRMRAVLHEIDRRQPLPPGLMLIGGQRQLIELTFDQLRERVDTIISQIRPESSPAC